MSIPSDSASPVETPRAWRVHMLYVPPAAARAGVRVARIDFDWRVPLASPAYAALSDGERARAARFLRHEDAVRSAATRAALRDVLGAALGVAPHAVALVVDESGRPSPDPAHRTELDFNVSHAGDHALLAWAPAGRVGVDIECCNRATDWRALTREVCAPAEADYLDSLPSAARAEAFMRVWSAKEALLKALGTGIVGGLRAFAVVPPRDTTTPATIIVEPAAPAAGVAAFDAAWLDAAPGYAACVAWTHT
ncbi:4'-phosphopantetheinyl transferase [Burkholderia stabilis]|uniref:4'-phosphopantetheinyl transferase family protein n=1 Tax=Burkholderia stabilis TaxID=95485 RepID=UPI000851BBAC|nr:4'-phosphopantetheinyl transferase superfamily protein [Burkholderia stabilis]AOR66064.1 4'-phosphopantetheinyl transferase [Burkholderia stabilis]HDR9494976.1 4'-phosphopantetheinyl transferase superfamily protein [Burkholderia stabilis]HDR9525620.1 4'-phosphopantetheinyl transferase superfamily protein [Burkholderia stabilis]HDR9534891.1 4'-phosphopantetheinyl transferase superfamily protein [Burkholderia stabilis]HDR9541850.1 4'-phosphopantetheinyl transferase superfamily protein [Burkho